MDGWAARSRAIALVAAAALACSGCSHRASGPLRIGINAEPGYEFAYLAQVRGLYAREGVNVRLVQFDCLSDSRRAFERGQLDGYFGTVFEVLQARANSGRSPRIVRVLDRSKGYDVVLGGPRARNVAALKGRRVGVEAGSMNVYLLSRALERHGLDLRAVTLVDLPPSKMGGALGRDEVDAVVTYPPASSAIEISGVARPIFSSSDIPGEVVDIVAFDALTLSRRGADVKAFLRAYDAAVAWSAGNSERAYAIMADREGLSPFEFKESLDQGLELLSPSSQSEYFGPGGVLPHIIRATSRVLQATGQVRQPIAPVEVLPDAGDA